MEDHKRLCDYPGLGDLSLIQVIVRVIGGGSPEPEDYPRAMVSVPSNAAEPQHHPQPQSSLPDIAPGRISSRLRDVTPQTESQPARGRRDVDKNS